MNLISQKSQPHHLRQDRTLRVPKMGLAMGPVTNSDAASRGLCRLLYHSILFCILNRFLKILLFGVFLTYFMEEFILDAS